MAHLQHIGRKIESIGQHVPFRVFHGVAGEKKRFVSIVDPQNQRFIVGVFIIFIFWWREERNSRTSKGKIIAYIRNHQRRVAGGCLF